MKRQDILTRAALILKKAEEINSKRNVIKQVGGCSEGERNEKEKENCKHSVRRSNRECMPSRRLFDMSEFCPCATSTPASHTKVLLSVVTMHQYMCM